MATQPAAPELARHVLRARQLNDREKKDIYHQPTQRGIVKRPIDLASPKPIGSGSASSKALSKGKWLESYLIREAKRNNWMLQLGENQYRIRYCEGKEPQRLHYVPCGSKHYRAAYSAHAKGGSRLRYVKCKSGRYRIEYARNPGVRDGLGYVQSDGNQYRVQFAHSRAGSEAVGYVKCGQRQYRLLCSHLDLNGSARQTRNGREHLSQLMYDEEAGTLVILELQSKRNLRRGKEELDANCEAVRASRTDIEEAFGLGRTKGIAGYIVTPSNGKAGKTTANGARLGKYGLIEYPDVPKPWAEFSQAKKQGKRLDIKLTCRKLADPVPLR